MVPQCVIPIGFGPCGWARSLVIPIGFGSPGRSPEVITPGVGSSCLAGAKSERSGTAPQAPSLDPKSGPQAWLNWCGATLRYGNAAAAAFPRHGVSALYWEWGQAEIAKKPKSESTNMCGLGVSVSNKSQRYTTSFRISGATCNKGVLINNVYVRNVPLCLTNLLHFECQKCVFPMLCSAKSCISH
jgi:hypothetical protein